MKRISYVIWDWNGTLLDDVRAACGAFNTPLVRRGIPTLSLEHYREIFGFPVRDFYRSAGIKLELEDWDRLAAEYHELYLADESPELADGAFALLRHWKEQRIGQSVVTVSEQTIVNTQIQKFGIRKELDQVIGVSNLHGASKRDLVHGFLDSLSIPSAEVLMVGDSLHDAELAREADTQCVLVASGHQSRSRLETTGFPVYDNLAALASAVLRQGNYL